MTRFLRAPLVTLWSNKVERLSASDFCARPTVIGDGLSVTRFLRAPLVTLWSNKVERLSASDLSISESNYINDEVTGDSLSLTKFTNASFVIFSPLSLPTNVYAIYALSLQFGTYSSNDMSPSSYGNPLSNVYVRVLVPSYGSWRGGDDVASGTLLTIKLTVTL